MSEKETPTLDVSVIDSLRVLEAGGATGLVAKVVEKFLENSTELASQIRIAATERDPASIVRAAHDLKSSSAHVGVLKLSELAKQLETLGRAGSMEGVPELVSRMSEELGAAVEALSDLGG